MVAARSMDLSAPKTSHNPFTDGGYTDEAGDLQGIYAAGMERYLFFVISNLLVRSSLFRDF